MADVVLADDAYRRVLRRERVFKDRTNPLETLSEDEVKARFRFFPKTIIYIAALLNNQLKRATKRSCSIPVILQVLVALRFYACGAYYLVIGDTINLSEATVCRCIRRVSVAIARLTRTEIFFPDGTELRDVKNRFYELAGFPNVVGCVDGCLIPIKKPHLNTQDFMCRKGFAAINTQVCCGPDNIIFYSSVKWPGAVHDSRVFEESSLRRTMEAAILLLAFELLPFPMLRSIVSRDIAPADQGSLFALMHCGESIIFFLGPLMFMAIFANTLHYYKALVLIVSIIMLILPFGFTLCLKFFTFKKPEDYERMEEPEVTNSTEANRIEPSELSTLASEPISFIQLSTNA